MQALLQLLKERMESAAATTARECSAPPSPPSTRDQPLAQKQSPSPKKEVAFDDDNDDDGDEEEEEEAVPDRVRGEEEPKAPSIEEGLSCPIDISVFLSSLQLRTNRKKTSQG